MSDNPCKQCLVMPLCRNRLKQDSLIQNIMALIEECPLLQWYVEAERKGRDIKINQSKTLAFCTVMGITMKKSGKDLVLRVER